MNTMLHKLSKYAKSVIGVLLIFLMILGLALDIPDAVSIQVSAVAYENDGETTFVQGDQIQVENTKCDTKNLATYTYNGTRWELTSGTLVWNSGAGANNQFHAWYPATAAYDSFTIPTDQSDSAKLALADWMTASTDAISKPENKELALHFQHRNAKVTVQVVGNENEYGDEVPQIGTVQIYTCDASPVVITPYQSDMSSYTAIVTPGKYTTQFMTIVVDGTLRTVNPTGMLVDGDGLVAGEHYHFTLTVGKEKLELTSVTVSDWENKNIDGGVAEEITPGSDNNQQYNTILADTSDAFLAAIASAEATGTAQNPATIKLTANIDLPGMASDPEYPDLIDCGALIQSGVMTIDLNGYTLSNTTANYTLLIGGTDIESCDAVVTVTDSSANQTGKISSTKSSCIYNSYGTLIIAGGTLTVEGTSAVTCINNNGGSVTINGGSFDAVTTAARGTASAVLSQGQNASLLINGGEFSSGHYCVNVASGSCSISGGIFTSEQHALYLQKGVTVASVIGGSFTGSTADITSNISVTGFLGFDESGNGAIFPDGISCSIALEYLLADGAGYYDVNGNLIDLTENDIIFDGTVAVKRISADT